jgi:hypothetical protein
LKSAREHDTEGKDRNGVRDSKSFIYGDRWHTNAAWCDRCESYVPLVTPLAAAELDKTTPEAIAERVDAGELHHRVTAEGVMLVCLGSLIDAGTPSDDDRVKKQIIRIEPATH